MAPEPYPLQLEPILKPKVWGGRRLQVYGKELGSEGRFGESWEVADLPSTSPSGGGGAEARSIITNGSLRGTTIGDALHLWRGQLVGARWQEHDEFPLLVKLLDAREPLSVQVHPTPEYASRHRDAHVKTESWYVIEAEPDAVLYIGLQPGVGPSELAAAVTAGTPLDVLQPVAARPGDCHHLPSGTVHALGAGIVVAEVQSPSDTTFRLYDWSREYDRPPRPLHVAAALESLLLDPAPRPTALTRDGTLVDLASTDRYLMRGVVNPPDIRLTTDRCSVVMVVEGRALITTPENRLDLGRGDTLVVPAAVGARTSVTADAGTVLITELVG